MSFSPKDLINYRIQKEKSGFLIENIDVEQPIHVLCHFRLNRIIALAKYKETINLLSNLELLQPFTNFQNYFGKDEWAKTKSILKTNTTMTYDVTFSYMTKIRFTSQDWYVINDLRRLPSEEIFTKETFTVEQVTELRLKAAALDYLFDRVNFARGSMISDIFCVDMINQLKIKQANDFLKGQADACDLISLTAQQFNISINDAAKYIQFENEEIERNLIKSELFKVEYQNRILQMQNKTDMENILREIEVGSRYQL